MFKSYDINYNSRLDDFSLNEFNFKENKDIIQFYFYYIYNSKVVLDGYQSLNIYKIFIQIYEYKKEDIYLIYSNDNKIYEPDELTKYFEGEGNIKLKYLVCLTGWLHKEKGHVINIVLERIDSNDNIYIINYGNGLQYHYHDFFQIKIYL